MKVLGVSPAAGRSSGQFDQKRNLVLCEGSTEKGTSNIEL